MIKSLVCLSVVTLLYGCASDGPGRIDNSARWRDAVPRAEPLSKRGNPDSYVQSGKRYYTLSTARGYHEKGIASWYGKKFHGRQTSNGETYNMYAMTAAHKTLPLPSYVRVTNLTNGRKVIVRVNDRGPFVGNRIIDLSFAAAEKLDMVGTGTALVNVVAIQPGVRDQTKANYESRYEGVQDWRDQTHLRNRIFIQVGAFSLKQNAEQMLRSLQQQSINNVKILQQGQDQGSVLHRVRIGPLASIAVSDQITAQLEKLGYLEYRVVVE